MTGDKASTRKSLEAFTLQVGLRGFYETLTGPSSMVFVAFALRLGVEKEKMGLIVSLVSLAALAQLLSFVVPDRVRSRKPLVLAVTMGEPLILAGAVLIVPSLPGAARLGALAALCCAAAGMLNLTSPVREDWLSATIPPPLRGRYLGHRVRVYGIVSLAALLAAGQITERWSGTGTASFTVVLGAGCLAGVLAVLALRRADMPDSVARARVTPGSFGTVVRNAAFLRYLAATAVYVLPFAVGAPYYQVFYLEALHLPKTVISYIYVGYWIVRLAGAPTLGRLVDRAGSRRAALCAAVVYVVFFIILTFSGGDRVWMVVGAWTLVGLADSLYNIAAPAALYGTVEQAGSRPAHFAVASLTSTATAAGGGVLGVLVTTALRGASASLGPFHLGQFHLLYLCCAGMVVVCGCGAFLLPGPRKRGPRQPRGQRRGASS